MTLDPGLAKHIRKVGDAIWEISPDYKEGMLVPARIFATEKLLHEMDAGVFDQVTNVASLPGLQKHAYCMPDGHWGYGFPIGGVAAFDLDTGVISPGGIGFDINCLVSGSKVLTGDGASMPIERMEYLSGGEVRYRSYLLRLQGKQVCSFDRERKSFMHKDALFFLKKRYIGPVVEVRTRLGFSVTMTPEHPLLTPSGMVPAERVRVGQQLAVHPFEGVPFDEPDDVELVSPDAFSLGQRAELEKRGLLPFTLRNQHVGIIARLFGYLLGDGIVYLSGDKGFICAYGKEEDLQEMQRDIAALDFSARIYSRERDHSIPTRYGTVRFHSTNHELHVSSRSLAMLFHALGYPQGDKTNTPYLVPEWLLAAPRWVKRLFLSGLFGAELSSPRTHTRTGFDCPTLSMNKNSILAPTARLFCEQLITLLREFGVVVHPLLERNDYHNRHGPTMRYKLQISSQEDNLLRLWSTIGYSYNCKRSILSQIACLYIREKRLLTAERSAAATRIRELRQSGFRLREVKALLASSPVNERFIARHFYEQSWERIPRGSPSFQKFAGDHLRDIEEHGCLFDTIESIRAMPYAGDVYDFTVPETHTFIADNVVVSNCGMRLITTNLTFDRVQPKLRDLVDTLFRTVPAGVGGEGFLKLNPGQFREIMSSGVQWCVENGYGWQEDVERIEEHGCIKGADPAKVSEKALSRGIRQLGTLGSGNHYLEVQLTTAAGIFDEKVARAFGITMPGQVVVMVHCGSRGFGHQVATDYLRVFADSMRRHGIKVKDQQLACAPFRAKEAQDYYAAMACAANMAFSNRQVIIHRVREAFGKVFQEDPEALGMHIVYDVAHNIAKVERHVVDGKKKDVLVHRKGSTRSFGPGHPELIPRYREVGQPVIIGGSMETGSYLLVGTEKAMEESFGSTAHGSGRTMSRTKAKQLVRGDKLQRSMEERGIYVRAASMSGLAEEAGLAYKDISEVVQACELAGISRKVVALKPVGNVKG